MGPIETRCHKDLIQYEHRLTKLNVDIERLEMQLNREIDSNMKLCIQTLENTIKALDKMKEIRSVIIGSIGDNRFTKIPLKKAEHSMLHSDQDLDCLIKLEKTVGYITTMNEKFDQG